MRRSRTSRAASSRLGGIFDYETKSERLEEVTRELENPNVWDNPERAQLLGKERSIERLGLAVERLTHESKNQAPT